MRCLRERTIMPARRLRIGRQSATGRGAPITGLLERHRAGVRWHDGAALEEELFQPWTCSQERGAGRDQGARDATRRGMAQRADRLDPCRCRARVLVAACA